MSRGWWLTIGGVLAGLVVLLGCALHTHPVMARIIRHKWRREIDIDTLYALREAGSYTPSGAYNVSNRVEVYTTRTGHKIGKVTVYSTHVHTRTIYSYTINRWCHSRTLAGAAQDTTPIWPDVSSVRPGNDVGCEREASRREYYYIDTTTTEGPQTVTMLLKDWSACPNESQVLLAVNMFGWPCAYSLPE